MFFKSFFLDTQFKYSRIKSNIIFQKSSEDRIKNFGVIVEETFTNTRDSYSALDRARKKFYDNGGEPLGDNCPDIYDFIDYKEKSKEISAPLYYTALFFHQIKEVAKEYFGPVCIFFKWMDNQK